MRLEETTMKKLAAVALVTFVAGISLGRLSLHAPAGAFIEGGRGADDVPSNACADTNGDAKVDLSDAVYLLNALFLGGPEPACPDLSQELAQCQERVDFLTEEIIRRRLPATGQTQCYDALGAVVPCSSAEFPGQDGAYGAGCPMEARYVGDVIGGRAWVWIDTCTGLMWPENTADTNGDGTVSEADRLSWQDALEYAEALILAADGTWTTSVTVAGEHGGVKYDDWKLPNVVEIGSLVDRGRAEPILPEAFKGGTTACYWSSTTVALGPETRRNAWYVFFSSSCQGVDKTGLLYVFPVRDAENQAAQ
jgi:hypothetical protein